MMHAYFFSLTVILQSEHCSLIALSIADENNQ